MTEGFGFAPGTACWLDVSTTDPAGSRDFYAGVLGWSYRIDPDPGSGHYTYACVDDVPVAGLSGLPAEPGQPIVWTLYLTSTNIGHTAAAVEQLGGRVLYGPVEIPDQGCMLVGADATGATIGFWQPPGEWAFRTHEYGALCWAELHTWDGARADEFYARLYGYRQEQLGDVVTLAYTTWWIGEQARFGRLQMGQEFAPDTQPHWVPYFAVDPAEGVDVATARVRELGGRVSVDPYDTLLGRIAVVADPSGALFALIDTSRRIAVTLEAAVDDPYDD